jgi:hypothetical protein
MTHQVPGCIKGCIQSVAGGFNALWSEQGQLALL